MNVPEIWFAPASPIVIEHSPSIDWIVAMPSSVCTVSVSASVGEVRCDPSKLRPPSPIVVASVPPAVHTSAIPPGAGVDRRDEVPGAALLATMSPLTLERGRALRPRRCRPWDVGGTIGGSPVADRASGAPVAPVSPVSPNADDGDHRRRLVLAARDASATREQRPITTASPQDSSPSRGANLSRCFPPPLLASPPCSTATSPRTSSEPPAREAARSPSCTSRSAVRVRLDDGKVEEVTTGLDRGAGVRVGRGTSFGYAYSNRLDGEALLEAAAAAAVARRRPRRRRRPARTLQPPVVHVAERARRRFRQPTRSHGSARPTTRRGRMRRRGSPGRRELPRLRPARADRHLGRAVGRGPAAADPAVRPGRRGA